MGVLNVTPDSFSDGGRYRDLDAAIGHGLAIWAEGADVVDVGGDMAGYGIMSVGAGEAHILNVCIRDEYRGRGFARRVLLYLLDRARASGMYEAFLEVRPSNTAAARLYHSMGFEQVGVRRGYYQATVGREDAAVLRRVLLPEAK